MSDRRPGPWDAPTTPTSSTTPAPARAADTPLDPGQGLGWALFSTVLLGGFIWVFSGSWLIAAAAIWGLLVHEYGHVLAMNRVGMGPARIYIIPFLGGLAKGQRMPESEWHGVLVSLAGPAFGLFAAIPFFAGYAATGDVTWLQGAFVIAIINLVNLAPAPPLDGSKALGPVLARIHPTLEMGAMLAVGAAVVWWGVMTGRWILATFLAIALIGHLRRGAWRPEGRPLTTGESVRSVGLFLVTGAACAGVAFASLVPAAGSPAEALSLGLRFFEVGQ